MINIVELTKDFFVGKTYQIAPDLIEIKSLLKENVSFFLNDSKAVIMCFIFMTFNLKCHTIGSNH